MVEPGLKLTSVDCQRTVQLVGQRVKSCIIWAHKPHELFLFKGERESEKDVLSRGVRW